LSSTNQHYENLATKYDQLWSHSKSFVDGMTNLIATHLDPAPDDRIVDLGGGTGIYSKALLNRVDIRNPILVVDPSPSMLAGLDECENIEPVVGDADSFSQSNTPVDRILIKEAVHHFSDPVRTLAELGSCLRPGGRILIVLLPPRIEYPLFRAALDKFEELQPHYLDIAQGLRHAELDIEIAHHTINVELPTSRYIDMVMNRYMSLLSEFSDNEIAEGVAEIQSTVVSETVIIPDRFVFVTGSRRSD
jgi:ubiquinone/menaquinone biosynthesis C-methylase UbiE